MEFGGEWSGGGGKVVLGEFWVVFSVVWVVLGGF